MANYILRKFDDALWQRFKARAASEGRGLRWIMLRLIQLYADGLVSVGSREEPKRISYRLRLGDQTAITEHDEQDQAGQDAP